MINKIIAEQQITSHKELDKYLAKLTGDRYYYSYPLDIKNELERVGLLEYLVIIEFDGVKRYYENEKL
jgi:hypothetical protein